MRRVPEVSVAVGDTSDSHAAAGFMLAVYGLLEAPSQVTVYYHTWRSCS